MRFRCLSCAKRCALALVILGSISSNAHAEEDVVPVTVDYSVIDGCPSESTFWAALSSRSSRVRRATDEDVATQLLVNVIVTPQGVLGRLQIARGSRVTEPRFVEAANCGQVVQALALTAALSVESETESEPARKPAEPEPWPYTDRLLDTAPPTPPASERARWQTTLHAGALGAMLIDRDPSVGATLGISFSRQRELFATQTLGLSIASLTTSILAGDANARFVLTEAELRGCPVTLGSQFLVRPCLAFQMGKLDAQGQNVSDPESREDTWWATGLSVEAEYPGRGPVRLHMALSAILPLAPQAYQLGLQPETITQTLPLTPWLSVGVAVLP